MVALVTHCVGNKWVTVAGSAVGPTLAMGMQAVSLDVSQMLS